MSATAVNAPAAADRSLDPTVRQRWRRWRLPIGVVLALIVFAVVLTVLQNQTSRGYLDPDGVNASGARALVRLLEDHGIEVTPVRTTDDLVATTNPGDTVVVTEPGRLLPEQIEQLTGTGADIVLVEPERIAEFGPDLTVAGEASEQVRQPECELPAATRAGPARVGGLQYEGSEAATLCYPADDAATLAVSETAGGERLVALGSSAPLTNRYLDQDGNAALAMGLLGANDRLTWYRPSYETPPDAQQSFTDLMPGWVVPLLWQLAVAAVLTAWWRARRLGPVVAEPLPVVVRAAEATEGRARLYRRGRSRAHAAAMLRDAAVRRLRGRLGIPAGAPVEAVADAITVRSTLDVTAVTDLLGGSEPADDAELVRLARSLDQLEQEVRNS